MSKKREGGKLRAKASKTALSSNNVYIINQVALLDNGHDFFF